MGKYGGVLVCGGGGVPAASAANVCGQKRRILWLEDKEAKALFANVVESSQPSKKRTRCCLLDEEKKKKKKRPREEEEEEEEIIATANKSFICSNKPKDQLVSRSAGGPEAPQPMMICRQSQSQSQSQFLQNKTEQQQQQQPTTSTSYKNKIAIARTKQIQIKREAARRALEKVEEEAAERIKKDRPLRPQDILDIFPALHYQYLCSWPTPARKLARKPPAAAVDSAQRNNLINAATSADGDDIEEGEIIL